MSAKPEYQTVNVHQNRVHENKPSKITVGNNFTTNTYKMQNIAKYLMCTIILLMKTLPLVPLFVLSNHDLMNNLQFDQVFEIVLCRRMSNDDVRLINQEEG